MGKKKQTQNQQHKLVRIQVIYAQSLPKYYKKLM